MDSPVTPKFLVGIGASAGGTTCMRSLFSGLETKEAAFFVLTHLSPHFPSNLHELIQSKSRMPVHRAENGQSVEAGNIYVLQPNFDIVVDRAHILLSKRDKQEALNFPIDTFLSSMAQSHGKNCLAVILSGTGSDGTRGARKVKKLGGRVLVLSPEEAEFQGMPESAISAGLADRVLPLEELRCELIGAVSSPSDLTSSGTKSSAISAQSLALNELRELILKTQGVDIQKYRSEMIIRGVERQLKKLNCKDPKEYLECLRKDPTCANRFLEELFIRKTVFFRDANYYSTFRKEAISKILQKKSSGEGVKIWVPGCSTGEDAYTTAMILLEDRAGSKVDSNGITVFATDVAQDAIAHASKGIYGSKIADEVPAAMLEKYFSPVGSGYQINRELRACVTFSPHNLLWNPPFTHLDAIVCRNVLIYFTLEEQKRLLSLFSFSLNIGGFLFLGPSESIQEEPQLASVSERERIFVKKAHLDVSQRLNANIFGNTRFRPPEVAKSLRTSAKSIVKRIPTEQFYHGIFSRVVADISLGAVLVNCDYETQYIYGKANEYLKFSGGKVSNNFLRMLPTRLALAVEEGFKRVQEPNVTSPVVIALNAKNAEEKLPEEVRIYTYLHPNRETRDFLILFGKRATPIEANAIDFSYGPSDDRIAELEQKLHEANESLHQAVEELKIANNDLLQSNEELQSTNEELQSVNEELYSVNSEYQNKIAELKNLGLDMDCFFKLTEIGTIILDQDLHVRRFTPAATRMIHLLPVDIGRKVTDLSRNFKDPLFVDDLQRTVNTGIPTAKDVCDESGLPYRMSIFANHEEESGEEHASDLGAILTFAKLDPPGGYQQANA